MLRRILIVICIAAFSQRLSAALTVGWVLDPIVRAAYSEKNQSPPSVNATLPRGAKSFVLYGTFTNGTRLGGGALRVVLPTGRFIRYTKPDPDTGAPVLDSFTRPGAVTRFAPAERYTSMVTFPNVLANDPTSGSIAIVGSVRPDGTQGPATEAIIPGTCGNLISAVWASFNPPPHADGTFALARLTTDGAIPIIWQGSFLATITASGGIGADVPLVVLPEPCAVTVLFVIAGFSIRRQAIRGAIA